MECICPILGRPTEVEPTAYSRGSWKIMRCRETGFVFLQDPPDYSRLEQEFAWEHTLGAERDRRAREEPIVHEMSTAAKTLKGILAPKRNKILSLVRVVLREKHPIRPLRVLDVGCATGDLLVKIHSQSTGHEIELHGIEVSNELHAICAERLASIGGVAHLGNAFDRTADFAAGSLDVVIMSSFLEHEAQPLELLRRVHSILSDDGAVVLKVPNLACLNRFIRGHRWCGFRFPDHVNYFTPHTLGILTRTAGFRVSRQGIFEKFPLNDSMYAVLKKSAA